MAKIVEMAIYKYSLLKSFSKHCIKYVQISILVYWKKLYLEKKIINAIIIIYHKNSKYWDI